MLPVVEQNVQTYIYLSDYNSKYLETEKKKIVENSKKTKQIDKIEFTTDINIFKNAIKNQELIQQFLKVIASTSIECNFLNNKNNNNLGVNFDCFNCISNNKQLYYIDLEKDMVLSNPCIKTNKIKAEEIIINGEKYYYTNKDNLQVFQLNNILNAYQLINDTNLNKKIISYIESKK
jgi:hypothetical protein